MFLRILHLDFDLFLVKVLRQDSAFLFTQPFDILEINLPCLFTIMASVCWQKDVIL